MPTTFKLDKTCDGNDQPQVEVLQVASPESNDAVIVTHFNVDSLICIKLNGQRIGALVDSGSAISCVSTKTLRAIKPDYKKRIQPTNSKFRSAQGNAMIPEGVIFGHFTVQGVDCQGYFYVFPTLAQKVILGRDFLNRYQVAVNYSKQTLTFKKSSHFNQPFAPTVAQVLNPGDVCFISASCHRNDVHLPTGLHGRVSKKKTKGITVHETLVTISDDSIPILVENTSAKPITLHPGQPITTFRPLQEDSLLQDHITDNSDRVETHDDVTPVHNVAQFIPSVTGTTNELGATNTHNDIDTTQAPFALTDSDMSPANKLKLRDILVKRRRAFKLEGDPLGFHKEGELELQMKPDARSICKMPFRYSPMIRDALKKQIQVLLDQNVIEESDDVEWCSPLLAVRKMVKKSQKHLAPPTKPEYRVVLDTRLLNSALIYSKIEIPSLASILDRVAESKSTIFSVCDLSSGYHQLPLAESSRKYVGFLYDHKSYRYVRCPQGISALPAHFSRVLFKVFRKLLGECVLLYLDDLLILSPNQEQHLNDIDKVLGCVEKAGLTLSPKKCVFGKDQVQYLGHQISAKGITPSDNHVNSVKTFPTPTNIRELRSFNGLCVYFGQFIPNKGELLAPLLELTRKNAVWNWTERQDASFRKLRDILSSKPLLVFPSFDKDFYVFTDSSSIAIGASLCQKCDETGLMRPVGYAGRALSKSERLRPINENECLAVVFAITTFSMYLTGRKFTVYCDNSSVKFLMNNKNKISPKLSRWMLLLSQYDYELVHLKGEKNLVADCLSRRVYDQIRTAADDKIDAFPENPCIDNVGVTDTSEQWHDTDFSVLQGVSDSESDAADHDPHCRYDIGQHNDSGSDQEDTDYITTDTNSDSDSDGDYFDLDIHGMHMLNKALGVDISPVMTRKRHNELLAEHKQAELESKMFQERDKLAVKIDEQNVTTTPDDTNTHPLDSKLHPNSNEKHEDIVSHDSDTDTEVPDSVIERSRREVKQTRTNHWRNQSLKAKAHPLRDKLSHEQVNDEHGHIWGHAVLEGLSQSEMRKHQLNDEFCGDLIRYLENDELPPTAKRLRKCLCREHNYCVTHGNLFQIWMPVTKDTSQICLRLVIPKSLQEKILTVVHNSGIGCHLGEKKSLSLMQPRFIWTNMVNDLRRFIASCNTCQTYKSMFKLEKTPIGLQDRSLLPFQKLSIDHLGPFRMTKRQNIHIAVVSDTFSGFIIAWPCKTVAVEPFVREFNARVVSVFGVPSLISSDRGSSWTSHL